MAQVTQAFSFICNSVVNRCVRQLTIGRPWGLSLHSNIILTGLVSIDPEKKESYIFLWVLVQCLSYLRHVRLHRKNTYIHFHKVVVELGYWRSGHERGLIEELLFTHERLLERFYWCPKFRKSLLVWIIGWRIPCRSHRPVDSIQWKYCKSSTTLWRANFVVQVLRWTSHNNYIFDRLPWTIELCDNLERQCWDDTCKSRSVIKILVTNVGWACSFPSGTRLFVVFLASVRSVLVVAQSLVVCLCTIHLSVVSRLRPRSEFCPERNVFEHICILTGQIVTDCVRIERGVINIVICWISEHILTSPKVIASQISWACIVKHKLILRTI